MKMVFMAILALAPVMSAQGATTAMADNPLLQPSTLPYQMPPFDRIRVTDYAPAFEAGMRAQLREVAAIAHDPHPPNFQNTIVALERSGQLLRRVSLIFDELNSNSSSPEMEAIDTEFSPKRSAHQDAIYLDHALWLRVDALYKK